MPSTFSPNLRLELIATGEQAANWGATTNTNVGSLLEQAITGFLAIAMSDANYTLTTGNGIVDESRNAALSFSGALTATRNIIVPVTPKLYVIRNNTSGSQSLLVKTPAGSGVTIANGHTQLVGSNGTNVVPVSLSVNETDGSLYGPTAAANSNTTQLATTAFVVGQAATVASPMNGTAAVGTSLRYAREDHVHARDTGVLPLAGGTMTGLVTLSGDPSAALGAATKQYTDAIVAAKMNIPTEGFFSGSTDLPVGSGSAVAFPAADLLLPDGVADIFVNGYFIMDQTVASANTARVTIQHLDSGLGLIASFGAGLVFVGGIGPFVVGNIIGARTQATSVSGSRLRFVAWKDTANGPFNLLEMRTTAICSVR